MLYVGRLHQSLDTELREAGWIRFIRVRRRRAYIVFEEVSLVHVLVAHRIVLLPHPLPAAPRRDEVEAAAQVWGGGGVTPKCKGASEGNRGTVSSGLIAPTDEYIENRAQPAADDPLGSFRGAHNYSHQTPPSHAPKPRQTYALNLPSQVPKPSLSGLSAPQVWGGKGVTLCVARDNRGAVSSVLIWPFKGTPAKQYTRWAAWGRVKARPPDG